VLFIYFFFWQFWGESDRLGAKLLFTWQAVVIWAEANEMLCAEKTVFDSCCAFLLSLVPLSTTHSNYFSATLNVIDFPAAFCASSYLLAVILVEPTVDLATSSGADGEASIHWRALHAISMLLLCFRQLRILLYMSSIGPLILMILRMVEDLAKWLVIIGLCHIGFTSAFYILSTDPELNCPEDMWTIAVLLWAAMLTGDTPHLCMLSWYMATPEVKSNTPTVRLPWLILLTNVYLLLSYMLMVNLLIALFSRSFDLLAESSVVNYQLLRGQSLLSWRKQPPAPPPLRLLRLPYEIGSMLLKLSATLSATPSSEADLKANDPELHKADFAELKSTMFANCIEYISAREDDAAAEDRWRMMLTKSITRKLKRHKQELHAEIERVDKKVAKLAEHHGVQAANETGTSTRKMVQISQLASTGRGSPSFPSELHTYHVKAERVIDEVKSLLEDGKTDLGL